MNILFVNGSPKGEYSITYQTCLYFEKCFPEHTYNAIHPGAQIKKYEKDFSEARAAIEQADLIVFSYPVYTFLVPSQLHRFIELLKEQNIDMCGKIATQISTSKHFYDITAHEFIRENAADMGITFIRGLSADMDDLTTRKGQNEAEEFFRYILWNADIIKNAGGWNETTKDISAQKPQGKNVAVVADLAPNDSELKAIIDEFTVAAPFATTFVNIHDADIKGGCISCFNCAADGTCIYKDEFQSLLRDKIQACDAIVLAFTVKDHSMGSRFKMYDDRQFCNGHRTVTMGMPFGYLVNGNLQNERNLVTVMEARAEVGGNFLAGIASPKTPAEGDDPCISGAICEAKMLAKTLEYAMEHKYVQPSNFYGVGGMKIFRDLIWLMQGLMRADHKFYKSHGQYDFPQKHRGRMLLMYLVGGMMRNKKLMKKAGSKVNEGMIAPYKKVLK